MSGRGDELPVAIIGGFLGAGKTTLLNRFLSEQHGQRIGVIVNDFGTLAFDEELTETASSHRRLLANGCVCCSIQNDLVETMIDLMAHEPPLDGVLVEASGVADPLALVATLLNAGFEHPPKLGAVVTVADAQGVREQERDYGGELVLRQLRAASVVVLNKCDLIDREQIDALLDWLSDIPARGKVLEAVHCDVPLEEVLGLGSVATGLPAGSQMASADDEFEDWSLEADTTFDVERLQKAFELLPAGVLRAKGAVTLDDGRRLMVQFASGRLELSPLEERPGVAGSRIVVIGRRGQLDPKQLERLFLS